MIQRIQTLYLAGVVALTALVLWLPLARFAAGAAHFDLYAFGLRDADGVVVQQTLYLGILASVTCLLAAVSIFLYKRRLLQLRLCVVQMVLLVGVTAFTAIYYFLSYRFFATFAFHAQHMQVAVVFPLVCLVLEYLAARAIFRDEVLVRSLDRIR